ncbi:hypothetical protein [Candidatus Pelagibacter sp. HIMB1695]|uniref:hypothetical protein n=1 Tax=Candidatus Pelagibacter sp. HIMB1695 TaxID=3413364 RepID=UPI003F8336E0
MKNFFLISFLILLNTSQSFGSERFIPLELFTGGEIREDKEIKFTNANLVFGEKKRKKIVGPEDWKNPQTGETIKVYKRTRKGQSGLKTQLFTVTNDGQCIGRVWDSRRGGRVIKNGCKFPLGVWKEGETRSFEGSSGGKPRKIELTILKLGKKQKDKVKFNWKLYDGSGKLMDDNDYTFSPGKAMSKLNDKKL